MNGDGVSTEGSELETSWGSPDRDVDIRALRRYHSMLCKIDKAGELLIFGLLFGVALSLYILLFHTEFDRRIFYDGTDRVCVYDERGIHSE